MSRAHISLVYDRDSLASSVAAATSGLTLQFNTFDALPSWRKLERMRADQRAATLSAFAYHCERDIQSASRLIDPVLQRKARRNASRRMNRIRRMMTAFGHSAPAKRRIRIAAPSRPIGPQMRSTAI